MSILVDYLCGKPKKDPKDRAMFTDLTESRHSVLPQRVGLGEALTLVMLLEAPCELRIRRDDLPGDDDRNIVAGILAAADSKLILCSELEEGEALDAQEWPMQVDRSDAIAEIVALMPVNGHRTTAISREELGDKARRMHDGLHLPYRLVASLLNDAEREAAGGPGAPTLSEAQVNALAKNSSALLTPEMAERVRRAKESKAIADSVLDLAGVTDLPWAELAPALLLLTRGRLSAEHIVVDDDWPELTPVRWQILHRLAERTEGTLQTGYPERLSPSEARFVDAGVDFVRDVYGENFMLMMDHPGRGLGLKLAIERYQRQRPGITLESLAARLNQDGYPARRSGQWAPANVREVILQCGIKMPRS